MSCARPCPYPCPARPSAGCLDGSSSLSGSLSSVPAPNAYQGDYHITPKAFDPQTLPTAHKILSSDIVVDPVPYFETSNASDGITVYIAAGTAPKTE